MSNFTQWLAVHMAQEYNTKLRVNAIAPGFFLTDQNRFLLTDKETGELTDRGKSILAHTPMARFGSPEDLAGITVWLCSDAAAFVTGIVVPVDGGFSAFSGGFSGRDSVSNAHSSPPAVPSWFTASTRHE